VPDHIGFDVKVLKAFIKTLDGNNSNLDSPCTVNEVGDRHRPRYRALGHEHRDQRAASPIEASRTRAMGVAATNLLR
jgi:hypothetical protein